MNKKIILLCFFLVNFCFSQKKQCESPNESLIDLSSISKCSIEKWESADKRGNHTTRQLALRLTSSRRRFSRPLIRRRKKEVSSLTSITSNSVNSLDISNANVGNIIDKKSELDDSVILPYSMVHLKPNFTECEDDNTRKCFDIEMAKHIKKHFSYPEEAYDKGIEGKVLVRFKINKYGEITNVNASTSYEKELLKVESERIISELPRFSPAKHTNKLVNVSYGVPIVFKIKDKNKRKSSKNKEIMNVLSFDEVDEVPVFNSCHGNSKENMAKCFNTEMVKHIQNNFSYPKLAIEKNITGKVWVNFIIDKKGDIRNIKLKGKDYILKTEARRIISLLPKLKPGKNGGSKVNTQYILPINFTLNND